MEGLTAEDPHAIGDYRLLGRLGAGGMGRVYVARSAGGRTVAVKLVRAELADSQNGGREPYRDFRAGDKPARTYTGGVSGVGCARTAEANRRKSTLILSGENGRITFLPRATLGS